MRILVIGAGVIGSVYAGNFAKAGHDVTLMARGSRLHRLRSDGLRLRLPGRAEIRPEVVITDRIPDGHQDLVIVAVRREQVMAAAEQAGRANAGTVLLFGNFAGLLGDLAVAAGAGRTIAGFPGVGGRLDADTLTYVRIAQQPTVLGELSPPTRHAEAIGTALRQAGFPTTVLSHIDDWLASHAALVVPLAAAIVGAGGSATVLSQRKDLLRVAVRATRCVYLAQRRSGRLTINANLRFLYLVLPEWFAALYWARALTGEFGELAFAAHSRHAWTEMAMLGAWLQSTLDADPDAADALRTAMGLASK